MDIHPIGFGNNIIRLDHTDSTNAYLQRLLNSGYNSEGLVVTAEFQNSGRGQKGTEWHSSPGANLLLSILLTPGFLPPDKQFALSQTIALAVRKTVMSALIGYDVDIKWPNDIWVEEKKVAGILIENTIQGIVLKYSIVGIGINIQNAPENMNAAPLNIFNPVINRELLEISLFQNLEYYYKYLRTGNFSALHEEYMHYLYAYRQQRAFFDHISQRAFTGIISGISPYGHLLVDSGEATTNSYGIKEISFI
jgi:BirA family biotin operon repressor/biotin-[acetyl-CoA-carboxylase] ligase